MGFLKKLSLLKKKQNQRNSIEQEKNFVRFSVSCSAEIYQASVEYADVST